MDVYVTTSHRDRRDPTALSDLQLVERFRRARDLRLLRRRGVLLGWSAELGLPIRRGRPTTRLERSIRRRRLHHPLELAPSILAKTGKLISQRVAAPDIADALWRSCACGDVFASAGELLEHLKGEMPSWQRVRFRYRDHLRRPVARPLPDHEIVVVKMSLGEKCVVKCACQWTSAVTTMPAIVARAHVRDVVEECCGGVDMQPADVDAREADLTPTERT